MGLRLRMFIGFDVSCYLIKSVQSSSYFSGFANRSLQWRLFVCKSMNFNVFGSPSIIIASLSGRSIYSCSVSGSIPIGYSESPNVLHIVCFLLQMSV